MSKIHIILQGKGGVGKSFVASVLAQYYLEKQKKAPLCIDTDPVNSTLHGFKKLNVTRLVIMEDDEINPRLFDNLVELVSNAKTDSIIDNGASSFVPLSHYLISNHVPELLIEMGHEMIVHTVITGSQALPDTLNGFDMLVSQFPEQAKIVVWLNPYFGQIESNGKTFEQFKSYLNHKDRITAIINMPAWKKETFGHDVSAMLQERLTFDQAIESEARTIMTKQRLKIAKTQIFEQLAVTPI
jgi:CobQ/CobB/MinD/ParA nucleotide binding domain